MRKQTKTSVQHHMRFLRLNYARYITLQVVCTQFLLVVILQFLCGDRRMDVLGHFLFLFPRAGGLAPTDVLESTATATYIK